MDIMLDLETMGVGNNAAIIAIGAVAFSLKDRALMAEFYTTVDLESAVASGGVIDSSTVLWWMKQSDAARKEFERPGTVMSLALLAFARWLEKYGDTKDIRMWGNGAAFDNVILANAYRNAGIPVPWYHWNDRCYRTVKALHPDVAIERSGTHHNALDDAKTQAKHLITMIGGKQA